MGEIRYVELERKYILNKLKAEHKGYELKREKKEKKEEKKQQQKTVPTEGRDWRKKNRA